jgi:BlaI family penicillinase repressor
MKGGGKMKLFDSELKVMEILWENGDCPAGMIATTLLQQVGWNRNTTYTVIKKLIKKGAIQRTEPSFMCTPLITRQQVQQDEAEEFLDKFFGGSPEAFLSTFVSGKRISQDEIAHLKQLIKRLEEGD